MYNLLLLSSIRTVKEKRPLESTNLETTVPEALAKCSKAGHLLPKTGR